VENINLLLPTLEALRDQIELDFLGYSSVDIPIKGNPNLLATLCNTLGYKEPSDKKDAEKLYAEVTDEISKLEKSVGHNAKNARRI